MFLFWDFDVFARVKRTRCKTINNKATGTKITKTEFAKMSLPPLEGHKNLLCSIVFCFKFAL